MRHVWKPGRSLAQLHTPRAHQVGIGEGREAEGLGPIVAGTCGEFAGSGPHPDHQDVAVNVQEKRFVHFEFVPGGGGVKGNSHHIMEWCIW